MLQYFPIIFGNEFRVNHVKTIEEIVLFCSFRPTLNAQERLFLFRLMDVGFGKFCGCQEHMLASLELDSGQI